MPGDVEADGASSDDENRNAMHGSMIVHGGIIFNMERTPEVSLDYLSSSLEETKALGKALASCLRPSLVVALEGDLGTGKTALVKEVIKAIDSDVEATSPTFNIVKVYDLGDVLINHIDAYRLEGQNIEMGLEEYLYGDGVSFVEWPMFIAPKLPDDLLKVEVSYEGEDSRHYRFSATGDTSLEVLKAIKEKLCR